MRQVLINEGCNERPNAQALGLYNIAATKSKLLSQVEPLIALKKKKYSNVDIEQPMSKEEKDLNAKISGIYSELNQLVLKKRSLMGKK